MAGRLRPQAQRLELLADKQLFFGVEQGDRTTSEHAGHKSLIAKSGMDNAARDGVLDRLRW